MPGTRQWHDPAVATGAALTSELHAHLYGCLSAEDLWELGRDIRCGREDRLDWYADVYRQAVGRLPDWRAYWTAADGLERLRADFEMRAGGTFAAFQARFNLAIALFPATPGDSALPAEILRRQRRSGVKYGEYRCFAPPALADQDLGILLRTLAGAADAVERESAGAFTPRIIVTLSRESAVFDRQFAVLAGALADDAAIRRQIVGVDFCGDESPFPPALMAPLYHRILDHNRRSPAAALALLAHVGEVWDHGGGWRQATRWVHDTMSLGVHRLGHASVLGVPDDVLTATPLPPGANADVDSAGARREHVEWLLANAPGLAEFGLDLDLAGARQYATTLAGLNPRSTPSAPWPDALARADLRLRPAVRAALAARGAVVESCPSSNLVIGRLPSPAALPVRTLTEAGVRVVVGADDPGIFATTLAGEERLLRAALGFTDDRIAALEASAVACRAPRLSGREVTAHA